MNQETLAAVTALADKLGTTAEYLWGVLLTQAPIHGITSLSILLLWILCTVFMVRFTITNINKLDEEVSRFFAIFGTVLLVAFSAILLTINATDIVTALFNPQFWALTQILK